MCNLNVPQLNWTGLVNWFTFNIKVRSLAAIISNIVFTCSVYCIWLERNCRVFRDSKSNELVVQSKIRSLGRNMILFVSSFKDEYGKYLVFVEVVTLKFYPEIRSRLTDGVCYMCMVTGHEF